MIEATFVLIIWGGGGGGATGWWTTLLRMVHLFQTIVQNMVHIIVLFTWIIGAEDYHKWMKTESTLPEVLSERAFGCNDLNKEQVNLVFERCRCYAVLFLNASVCGWAQINWGTEVHVWDGRSQRLKQTFVLGCVLRVKHWYLSWCSKAWVVIFQAGLARLNPTTERQLLGLLFTIQPSIYHYISGFPHPNATDEEHQNMLHIAK